MSWREEIRKNISPFEREAARETVGEEAEVKPMERKLTDKEMPKNDLDRRVMKVVNQIKSSDMGASDKKDALDLIRALNELGRELPSDSRRKILDSVKAVGSNAWWKAGDSA
tara:strand:+ start:715 stop:1050 length:336 start_codon:yes stop_codon:yes gene_type:complete